VTELVAILEDAEPQMVIHDTCIAETTASLVKLLRSRPKLFTTDNKSPSDSINALFQQERTSPSISNFIHSIDDPAILIYTGGTTGRPKGVMHSHRGMAAWNMLTPSAGFGYDLGRRVLVLNLSHLVGQFQLWATMAAGGSLVFLDEYPADVHHIMKAVERERITHLSTVGQLLRDLIREATVTGKNLDSLKVIGCGGSVISPETLRDAVLKFPKASIVNNYSQAECGMSISRMFPSQHIDDPIRLRSVGRPADLAFQGERAFQVRIVDKDGSEVAPNEPGEIIVRGAQTMLGYWNNPGVTNEVMSDGWIRTGDIGCMDAEGYLYVLDRLKDMIIVNGSNVFCSEVELVIASHELVSEAAVIGLPLPEEGEELSVCVVLRQGGSLDLEKLRAYCEPRLAPYKWPTRMFVLDELPRTVVDKVDKKRLRIQLSMFPYDG